MDLMFIIKSDIMIINKKEVSLEEAINFSNYENLLLKRRENNIFTVMFSHNIYQCQSTCNIVLIIFPFNSIIIYFNKKTKTLNKKCQYYFFLV